MHETRSNIFSLDSRGRVATVAAEANNPDSLNISSFEDFDDEFAFWPLNLVLVILGASVIGVAFVYLDPRDARLHYNPWLYVVATPIVLGLISVVLRTLVSRVIQKSMQMAFLVSVLIHLFLLVGAMNVVIFSRLWPDMLDKMAKERHALKRQSLQAPQYQRVTSTKQQGARPDYLKHVPTEHEATDAEIAEKLAVSLTESAINNLVSPEPKIERSANPHLIEKSQPTPAMPTRNEQAASLSRSDLKVERQMQNEELKYEMPQMQASPKLAASAADTSRSRQDSSVSSELMDAPANSSSAPSEMQMVRNESRESASSASSQAAASMERSSPSSQAAPRPSNITAPNVASSSSRAQPLQASQTNSQRETPAW